MTDNIVQKSSMQFICKDCDYNTCRKSQYQRHVLTLKHKNTDKPLTNTDMSSSYSHICHCGKKYKHRQSLFSHKKSCLKTIEHDNNCLNQEITPELILNIIQQNQEFKDMLLEQSKMICEMSKSNAVSIVNNTNTNNSHNKTFNLQVFLNETCKDAMNMSDFVNSIQLQLTDFENVGEQGYVNGISNIIIKNLKLLDENMRPVHCSDIKRESIYIKENNQWKKDTEDNESLKKVIKAIANKNTQMMPKYREKYPETQLGTSKASDTYSRFVIEALGGAGDNKDEKNDKIVKKIAKEVLINKNSGL